MSQGQTFTIKYAGYEGCLKVDDFKTIQGAMMTTLRESDMECHEPYEDMKLLSRKDAPQPGQVIELHRRNMPFLSMFPMKMLKDSGHDPVLVVRSKHSVPQPTWVKDIDVNSGEWQGWCPIPPIHMLSEE